MILAYVNGNWRNTESNTELFANDCIIYRKIMDSISIDMLQTDLNSLVEWVLENKMKVNAVKSKAVIFTKARVKEQIGYYFGDQLIPEVRTFKYLGIIIGSNLT